MNNLFSDLQEDQFVNSETVTSLPSDKYSDNDSSAKDMEFYCSNCDVCVNKETDIGCSVAKHLCISCNENIVESMLANESSASAKSNSDLENSVDQSDEDDSERLGDLDKGHSDENIVHVAQISQPLPSDSNFPENTQVIIPGDDRTAALAKAKRVGDCLRQSTLKNNAVITLCCGGVDKDYIIGNDPNDYSVPAGSFYKRVFKAESMGPRIILHWYDMYWAYYSVRRKNGFICPAHVVERDGTPTGFIIKRFCRTRCNNPDLRVIAYCVEDNDCYLFKSWTEVLPDGAWTNPEIVFDHEKVTE